MTVYAKALYFFTFSLYQIMLNAENEPLDRAERHGHPGRANIPYLEACVLLTNFYSFCLIFISLAFLHPDFLNCFYPIMFIYNVVSPLKFFLK